MMENRGPQSVQERNGYPDLRSRGPLNSSRHFGHVPKSGRTHPVRVPPVSLWRMEKGPSPPGGISPTSKRWKRTRDGASFRNLLAKLATAAEVPSTSRHTPAVSFLTNPASPSSDASRAAKGRNPTPCTVPSRWNRSLTAIAIPNHRPISGTGILVLVDVSHNPAAQEGDPTCDLAIPAGERTVAR